MFLQKIGFSFSSDAYGGKKGCSKSSGLVGKNPES
jgi:hypothetical protein